MSQCLQTNSATWISTNGDVFVELFIFKVDDFSVLSHSFWWGALYRQSSVSYSQIHSVYTSEYLFQNCNSKFRQLRSIQWVIRLQKWVHFSAYFCLSFAVSVLVSWNFAYRYSVLVSVSIIKSTEVNKQLKLWSYYRKFTDNYTLQLRQLLDLAQRSPQPAATPNPRREDPCKHPCLLQLLIYATEKQLER